MCLSDRSYVMQEPNLGDAVVGGVDPFVPLVLVGKERAVLVGPGEFEGTRVVGGHSLLAVER